ncbi:hypothetical protein EJB05_41016, partial [Eragrostis curvula]
LPASPSLPSGQPDGRKRNGNVGQGEGLPGNTHRRRPSPHSWSGPVSHSRSHPSSPRDRDPDSRHLRSSNPPIPRTPTLDPSPRSGACPPRPSHPGVASSRQKGTPPSTPRMDSKRRRSHSPVEHKEGCDKDYESSGRNNNSRNLEDSNNARPVRGYESRQTDRNSYGASRESRRHDDYRRYHDKHANDHGRSHSRASRSDRESRADTYYDRSKRDGMSGRARGDQRDADSRYGEKYVSRDLSKNDGKQATARDYRRHDGGECDSYTDASKVVEKRDYRAGVKDKEIKEEDVVKKRNGKEIEKEAEGETREKKRSLFSSGPNVGCPEDAKLTSAANETLNNSGGTLEGVNAAKVAAMKAAELVNRNIASFGAGTGRLSTDQKKKLLWGNKKSNPSEETSKRWDLNLFSDRERQEKFNKLMGVKSSAPVQETKLENNDGNSAEAKKLEELDTNLEKHYIAGLRRRDGRTVGLGL